MEIRPALSISEGDDEEITADQERVHESAEDMFAYLDALGAADA